MSKCICCNHPELDHLDEGGERTFCWTCFEQERRKLELAWGAGRIKRWFHTKMKWHMWFMNKCVRCGIDHP